MNGFWPYFLRRMVLALLTLFIILLVTYVLLRCAPGDPTRVSAFGDGKGTESLSSEKSSLGVNELVRRKLHYDRSPAAAFFIWLGEVARGDLGTSVSVDKGRPVTDLIMERLPVTLKLNVISLLIVYLFSIPLGVFSGVHPGSKGDRIITFLLFFLYSLPMLWTALMLQALFCKGGLFPVFPLKGLEPVSEPGMSTWQLFGAEALHYVLPVLCMSYAGFAGLCRYTGSAMMDVMKSDYIRTARAKGVPEWSVIFHHAFRNTLVVMVTLFAGVLPGLIGGSLIVEVVFSIPGMGALSMTALESRDVPLLMALFAFGSVLTLAGMLIADILYVFVDPRITFAGRD